MQGSGLRVLDFKIVQKGIYRGEGDESGIQLERRVAGKPREGWSSRERVSKTRT